MKTLKNITLVLTACVVHLHAQNTEKDALKFALNQDGTHFIQATFLNQVWFRVGQNNPGTLMQNSTSNNFADIGLRRTRMQLFGQLNDHVFFYFQFGQNNFNSQYNIGANRKNAAFFHDALCEYKVTKNNALKLGGGLTIANGLSRFSQPSIGTIMTLDVPVFAQATVDQTDQFSRKLSLYARGQIGHLDYRLVFSDPFPISSNGAAIPAISRNATFTQIGRQKQFQYYFIWQFFEQENHTTPYMTGTYLGKKKIFNIAIGNIFQKNATWSQINGFTGFDTLYHNMNLQCIESFLDMPLNKDKGTAVSAYAGFFNTQYGANYLRLNGIMNPANSVQNAAFAKPLATDAGPQYGNALPMFGTGQVLYSQVGFLLPKKLLKNNTRLMPYVSATFAKYQRLNNHYCKTYNAGINYFITEHKSKITLDFQNRPSVNVFSDNTFTKNRNKNCITLQYQIFF